MSAPSVLVDGHTERGVHVRVLEHNGGRAFTVLIDGEPVAVETASRARDGGSTSIYTERGRFYANRQLGLISGTRGAGIGSRMAECGSCHAPIVWTLTAAGKKAPIDQVPAPDGNVLVLSPSIFGGELLSVVLSGEALERARRSGELRLNHWATCPDKAAWRAAQDAKRKASETQHG